MPRGIYSHVAIIRPNLRPSPELAYILGTLLGDGSVYPANRTTGISLTVKSYRFALTFAKALRKIGLRPWGPAPHTPPASWAVVASSKLFGEWYRNLSWDAINNLAKQYPHDFLRGLYDSEGSYYLDTRCGIRKLSISNTKKHLLELASGLIQQDGLYPRIYRSSGGKNDDYNYYALRLHRKGEPERFRTLINPSHR